MLLTKSLEDYLEAILIEEEKGIVRVKDLVKRLGVKAPSVAQAIKTLKEKGMVAHKKYGYITLTNKGKKKAKEIYQKHKSIFTFLKDILGVSDGIAEKDACSLEHFLSPETMKKLVSFIDFFNKCPEEEPRWIRAFKEFYNKGKYPENCEERREKS